MILSKITVIRRIISGKAYYQNRMAEMDRKCAFYLDQGMKASNQMLRKALFSTAEMYYGRYRFYFNKITNNEIRKSIQN